MRKSKKTTLPNINYATYGAYLLIAFLLIFVGCLYHKFTTLQNELLAHQKNNVSDIKNLKTQYTALQDRVIAQRKIYVYNLEEILTKSDIMATKKEFEENLIKLNNELTDGQKRIKSLHDAKIKEDFSEVYLNNLRSKRDELVNHYDKKLDELADKINKALTELCKEKDIPTVFLNTSIAITTDDVIDLTDEILEKIKNQ